MDFPGAKQGRYGGTFANKDIAFEFGTYISPEFKFLSIKKVSTTKKTKQIGLPINILTKLF